VLKCFSTNTTQIMKITNIKSNKFQKEQINLHDGDVKLFKRGNSGIWQIKLKIHNSGRYFRKSLKTRDQALAIALAESKYEESSLKRLPAKNKMSRGVSMSPSHNDNVLILVEDPSLRDRLANLFKRNFSVYTLGDIYEFNGVSFENKIDLKMLQAFFKFRRITTVILSRESVSFEQGVFLDFILSIKTKILNNNIKFYYLNNGFKVDISDVHNHKIKKIDISIELEHKHYEIIDCATREYITHIILGVSSGLEFNFLNNNNLKGQSPKIHLEHNMNSIIFTHIDDIYNDICGYSSNKQNKSNLIINKFNNIKEKNFIPIKEIKENKALYTIFDKASHQHNCVFEAIYRMNPNQHYGENSIANFRYNLGKSLASSLPKDIQDQIDIVVPVPETGKYYAQGLSNQLNKKYVEGFYKNEKKGRGFDIQDHDKRRAFLYSKLGTISDLFIGKSICLVDEAIFTGATLKVATNLLNEFDIKSCFIAIPSPPCVSKCPYDMMPERNLLLEYQRKESLAEYFNVEGVFFIDAKNFKSNTDRLNEFCSTCFD
jgi:hypothetical protein